MKNKILKISLLALFLLSLMLPMSLACFAVGNEDNDVISRPGLYPNWADYIDVDRVGAKTIELIKGSFLRLYSAQLGNAGSLLLHSGSSLGDVMTFFKSSAIISGSPIIGDSIISPETFLYLDVDGTIADCSFMGNCTVSFVYGHYTDYQTKVYSDVACRYMQSRGANGVVIEFAIDVENGTDSIVYKSTNSLLPYDSITLYSYTIDGVTYTADDGLFYVAVMAHDEQSISILSSLAPLFFGADYSDCILFPLSYAYNMIVSPYIQDIYDLGYDLGYDDGVLMGETSNNLYEEGYNDAIRDIDSGEFGKNFLGTAFRAPFQVLRSFTLVEWQLSNGTRLNINLMTLFSAFVGISLFVWFLKTFAGG